MRWTCSPCGSVGWWTELWTSVGRRLGIGSILPREPLAVHRGVERLVGATAAVQLPPLGGDGDAPAGSVHGDRRPAVAVLVGQVDEQGSVVVLHPEPVP